ncbi:hypothetical protein M2480_002920 [Parabacteroides sp. PFB2-12]|nr:hypothetical protein [Parabacteroides sp. PM6-13]MDH6391917.1 hypothetical protein [Parabacteroides sp. PFB2-12]
MLETLHIIFIVFVIGYLAYKIIRFTFKWIRSIYRHFVSGQRTRAFWLLLKGFIVITVICVAGYYIKEIVIGLIAIFVVCMHWAQKDTIIYTHDEKTIIK